MAGYVIPFQDDRTIHSRGFHIDTPNVRKYIQDVAEVYGSRRVITLQLDSDELDAALWGLENYVKPVCNCYSIAGDSQNCPIHS